MQRPEGIADGIGCSCALAAVGVIGLGAFVTTDIGFWVFGQALPFGLAGVYAGWLAIQRGIRWEIIMTGVTVGLATALALTFVAARGATVPNPLASAFLFRLLPAGIGSLIGVLYSESRNE